VNVEEQLALIGHGVVTQAKMHGIPPELRFRTWVGALIPTFLFPRDNKSIMGNLFGKRTEQPPMVITYGYPFNQPAAKKSKTNQSWEYTQAIGPELPQVPAGFDPYERRYALPPQFNVPPAKPKSKTKSNQSWEYSQAIGPELPQVPAGFDPYERRHALPPRFKTSQTKKPTTRGSKRSASKRSGNSSNSKPSKPSKPSKQSRLGSFHPSRDVSMRTAKSQSLFQEEYNPYA
jgi:hypothetical protein